MSEEEKKDDMRMSFGNGCLFIEVGEEYNAQIDLNLIFSKEVQKGKNPKGEDIWGLKLNGFFKLDFKDKKNIDHLFEEMAKHVNEYRQKLEQMAAKKKKLVRV